MASDEEMRSPAIGRPPKLEPDEETLREVEGLGRIQCTQREAAAVLRVHRNTFMAFLNTHEKAREAWENGLEQGKASLRRLQYKNAESGNATMQVWLGKQWLDQRDKIDEQISGPGGGPVQTENTMSETDKRDLARWIAAKLTSGAKGEQC